jgi:hypothetical protein
MSRYQSKKNVNGLQSFMIDWSGDDSSHDTGATREAKQKSDESIKETKRYQDPKLDFKGR